MALRDYLFYEEPGITLYCGDNREILPLLEDESIDLIVTDPPYGLNFNNGDFAHMRERVLGRSEKVMAPRPIAQDSPEEWEPLMRGFLKESWRLLKDDGCCCCCCCGGGPQPIFARLTLWMNEYLRFKQAVVWDKGGLGMGWHYRRSYEFMLVAQRGDGACKWFGGRETSNVLRIPKIIPSADEHPTEKPIALMGTFISLHSQRGDLVLDPFMGHGPTIQSAKGLGRRAIGIEIEPTYCEIAVKRLRQEVLAL